jgi:hypothetical protein
MKVCTHCKQERGDNEFPRVKAGEEKRRTYCKHCVNAYTFAKRNNRKPETFASPKPEGALLPRRDNLFDRPVYQPPKWGR